MTTYYTYHVYWTAHNIHYYGVRGTNLLPCNDLWKTYFTSSKYVKEFRKNYGEPDVVEIRKIFADRLSALNWEKRFLIKVNAKKSNQWLNRYDGTYNGAVGPKNHGDKVSSALTGIKKSKTHRENVSKSLTGKYVWLTDGEINVVKRAIEVSDFLIKNPNFYHGRVFSEETKTKMSSSRNTGIAEGRIVIVTYDKSGINNPMHGKKQSEDAKHSISAKAIERLKDPSNRPYGAKNGMYGKRQSEEAKKESSLRTSNKRWYTDDTINIFIDKDLEPPIGFRKGKKKSKHRTKKEIEEQRKNLRVRGDKDIADRADQIK
jgi:hypothetical protein